MACRYCLTENDYGQVFLSLRKDDESEQLLLDFSSKLLSLDYEPAVLPEGILVLEENRYTSWCFDELVKAQVVYNKQTAVTLHGIPCVACVLTEKFNIFRESRKTGCAMYNVNYASQKGAWR